MATWSHARGPRLALHACGLLSVLLALAVWASPAHAHTGLVRSNPAPGEVVPLTLDRLTLEFDDQIRSGSDVVVRGPDGSVVSHGRVGVLGAALDVRLDLTDPGEHTVDYRVVGADGHPQVGSLAFRASVDAAAGPGTAPTPSPTRTATAEPSEASYWLVPVLGLAALVLVVHTAAGATTRRRRAHRASTST